MQIPSTLIIKIEICIAFRWFEISFSKNILSEIQKCIFCKIIETNHYQKKAYTHVADNMVMSRISVSIQFHIILLLPCQRIKEIM